MTGSQFPADYRGDAFVALHGSWNAATPTGYKVVRIKFTGKRPAAGYENFVTGWWRVRQRSGQGHGPAGGPRRGQGWQPADRRRCRQGDLAVRYTGNEVRQSLVELSGIEPLTSSLRTRRSPN